MKIGGVYYMCIIFTCVWYYIYHSVWQFHPLCVVLYLPFCFSVPPPVCGIIFTILFVSSTPCIISSSLFSVASSVCDGETGCTLCSRVVSCLPVQWFLQVCFITANCCPYCNLFVHRRLLRIHKK